MVRFVRAGTLDKQEMCPPDIHIWTGSKQPWVVVPEGVTAFEETYESKEKYWPTESMERWKVFNEKVKAWEAKQAEGGKEEERNI